MNRFVRDGLLAEMRAGRRVLLIAENGDHAQACLATLAERSHHEGEAVRRSRGAEEIRGRAGGFIRILSARSESVRGISADILFVDTDVTSERLTVIVPAVMASELGELIHR